MADTKVSDLTAASALTGPEEFPISDGTATSKAATATQIKTFVNNAPVFAAGGTGAGTWPKLTSGSLLTTPEAGALELANDVLYGTSEAGNRGVMVNEHLLILNASYTLTNTASEQKAFDGSTNGTLNLATGTYFFEALLHLTSMSGTSGNFTFDLLGAGTATFGTTLYHAVGLDNTTPSTGAANGGSFQTAAQSTGNITTAGTGTACGVSLRGMFRLSSGGTIIPSVSLTNAAAAVVSNGSYFKCHRVGGSSVVTVGDWS